MIFFMLEQQPVIHKSRRFLFTASFHTHPAHPSVNMHPSDMVLSDRPLLWSYTCIPHKQTPSQVFLQNGISRGGSVLLVFAKTQGGRTWQAFGGGKNGHETFRQARIYNFRDKCVVFARNLKVSNLTQ